MAWINLIFFFWPYTILHPHLNLISGQSLSSIYHPYCVFPPKDLSRFIFQPGCWHFSAVLTLFSTLEYVKSSKLNLYICSPASSIMDLFDIMNLWIPTLHRSSYTEKTLVTPTSCDGYNSWKRNIHTPYRQCLNR